MKATFTENHDRLAIKVKEDKKYVTLSITRGGERCSGGGVTPEYLKEVFDSFIEMVKKNKGTYGDLFQVIKKIADEATNLEAFATALKP